MKALALLTSITLTGLNLLAVEVPIVQVDSNSISCAFNTNCTVQVSNRLSAFTLPNTTGTGYVYSAVISGDAGTELAGRYGYEYRLDLSGLRPSPDSGCVTNVVRWATNRVLIVTNVAVCRTNVEGAVRQRTCVTNQFPATNLVVCLTNFVPGTNIQRCVTNAAGVISCFTNSFPGTNFMICFTNRIPARTVVTCQTNVLNPGTNVVTCRTNTLTYLTNLVTVRTNTIPCPGLAPCVEWVRIAVGRLASRVDLDSNGVARDWVYVITNGAPNSAIAAPIFYNDGNIVLRFTPPLCPGESSLTFGFISNDPPTDANARGHLTSGSNFNVSVIASGRVEPIRCDLSDLREELRDLANSDLIGATTQIRRERRAALLELAEMAADAARVGNAEDFQSALEAIAERTDGGTNDWVVGSAARDLNRTLDKVLRCLHGKGNNGKGHGHDDDDDDDEDNDDNDQGNGQGKGKGKGHSRDD